MQIANPGPGGPTPDHAQVLAERHRKRVRRRFAAWGAFLLLGLLMGAVYATGFATIGGTAEGGAPDAEALYNSPNPKQGDESELGDLIEPVTSSLKYVWSGRWGEIETAVMYEIDLSEKDSSEKFFSEVLLINEPSGFSDLQLQLRIAEAEAETCSAADIENMETASNFRVMYFETADAQVTFKNYNNAGDEDLGLPGEATYCIGLDNYDSPVPGAGKDESGTFIRKNTAGGTQPNPYPKFVATLNRME